MKNALNFVVKSVIGFEGAFLAKAFDSPLGDADSGVCNGIKYVS